MPFPRFAMLRKPVWAADRSSKGPLPGALDQRARLRKTELVAVSGGKSMGPPNAREAQRRREKEKRLDNNPVGGFHQLAPWLHTGDHSIIRVFFVARPARSILIRKDWSSDYLSVPIPTLRRAQRAQYLFVRRARTEPWPALWEQRKSGEISAEWNKQTACGRWISLLIMPPKT